MKKLKKISMLLLAMALVLSLSTRVSAKDIEVVVNEEKINFDVAPNVISGRTMIPLRATLESLGADVEWDNKAKVATASTDRYNLYVTLNNKTVVKEDKANGTKENHQMDVAPVVINGRTLVPVRFMAEQLNKAVIWDKDQRKVIILDTNYILNKLKVTSPTLHEYLQKTINGEIKPEANSGSYTFVLDMDTKYEDKTIKFKVNIDVSFKIYGQCAELHVKVDSKSFKTTLETIMSLIGEDIDFGISPSDLEVDLFYNGSRYFITSPLLKNEELREEFGIKSGAQNGMVVSVDEDLKVEINDLLSSFGKESKVNIQDVIDEALKSISDMQSLNYLNEVLDLVGYIYSDNNFKKTNDGYTFTFNDINGFKNKAKSIDPEIASSFDTLTAMNVSASMNIKGNVITKNSGSWEFAMDDPSTDTKVSLKLISKEEKDEAYVFAMPSLVGVFDYDQYMSEMN